MFDMMDAARLEGLHLAQDPATGLKAIIAIHSTRLGPALGGCRYLPYPNDEAATRPGLGGCRLGRFIESLGGRYITAWTAVPPAPTWTASPSRPADMDCIAQQTRHVSTTQAGDPRRIPPSAFAGIRASAQARLGSDDLEGLGRGAGARPRRLRIGRATGGRRRAAGLRPRSRPGATGRRAARCPSAGAGGIALHPLRHPRALRPGRRAHQPERQPAARRWPGRRTTSWAAGGRRRAGGARHPLCAGLRDQLRRPDLRRPQAPRRRSAQHHRHLARIPARLTEIYAHAQADHQSPARIADRLAERILYGPQ